MFACRCWILDLVAGVWALLFRWICDWLVGFVIGCFGELAVVVCASSWVLALIWSLGFWLGCYGGVVVLLFLLVVGCMVCVVTLRLRDVLGC